MENLTTDSLLGKVLDVHVCVCGQLLQHWLHLCLQGTLGQRWLGLCDKSSMLVHICHIFWSEKHPILKLQQQHTCCQGRGRSSEGTWPHWSGRWPPGHWTSWEPLVAFALWWCPGHMPLTKPAIHQMIVSNDDNRIFTNTQQMCFQKKATNIILDRNWSVVQESHNSKELNVGAYDVDSR